MKKLFIVALVLCAAAFAGTLVADSAPATLELSDVLPGTVLDGVLDQAASEPIQLCPRPDIYCFDIWDPVTCDDGVTYSNACYAYRACATGCSEG